MVALAGCGGPSAGGSGAAASSSASPGSAAPSSTPAGAFPSPQDYQRSLGAGLDVDWSKTSSGLRQFSEQTVRDLAARGMTTARIRVVDDVTPQLLTQLDQQVRACEDAGVVPVIAYQADAFKKDPSPARLQAAVAWWQAVAAHFGSTAPTLSFDLIIEVTDALSSQPDTLNAFYEQAVSAIRADDPQRNLFISPTVRSDPDNFGQLVVPSRADGHLLAEWHFYAAGPDPSGGPKGWTTGTPAEKQAITDKIAAATTWSSATGIPTWVGAWMPSNYNDGNSYTPDQQVQFATFLACSLQSAAIPYAVNQQDKFYDGTTHTLDPELAPVLDAALRPTCS
ncbi:cellulase family glycosylhydrolase [Rhodococcus aerolatus]